jgi:hypothetical protein
MKFSRSLMCSELQGREMCGNISPVRCRHFKKCTSGASKKENAIQVARVVIASQKQALLFPRLSELRRARLDRKVSRSGLGFFGLETALLHQMKEK